MSNRPITEDDLHAYVDQLLEPERRGEVTAYLDAHSDVARRVAGFSDQRALLRNALAPIAHEPLPPELNLSRIIEGRRRRLSPWRAVAAVLLIGIGGIGGWIARGAMPVSSNGLATNGLATNGLATNGLATNGLAALEQEAADSFKVYAPDRIRPVEVRASEGTQLERWLSNRLRQPIKVPDLTTSGYRLMGGRLIATSHGPAAMFMYDDDRGDRLVVLARPMAVELNAPMKPQSRSDVAGYSWADGGMGYSLVGLPATESLRPIANEVRKQAQTI